MPRESLIGQHFGKLTVMAYKGTDSHNARIWECQCTCGNTLVTNTSKLKLGRIKSCKDCIYEHPDLTGQRFSFLTVIKRDYSRTKNRYWLCKCDCGNEKSIREDSLLTGKTRSCGCYSKKMRPKKHGMHDTRIYRIWSGMKERCTNSNRREYKYYGGKGITISEEWDGPHGFQNFYEWALQNGYNDELSIDRIDNNKGYSSSNCRWVTTDVQLQNRSSTVYMTFNGETKPITEWSRIVGLSRKLLNDRKRRGWDDEKSLTTPIKTYRKGENT